MSGRFPEFSMWIWNTASGGINEFFVMRLGHRAQFATRTPPYRAHLTELPGNCYDADKDKLHCQPGRNHD